MCRSPMHPTAILPVVAKSTSAMSWRHWTRRDIRVMWGWSIACLGRWRMRWRGCPERRAAQRPLPFYACSMKIRVLQPDEIAHVIPLLLLAEPSEGALRWSLNHLSDTVYGLELDGEWAGAATLKWQSDPSEIVELAIAPERQGMGLGKYFLAWLVAEAKRREREALLVGTSNASIGSIAFYQKCGFRMDHVRRDYFWYEHTPRFENGIQVRD